MEAGVKANKVNLTVPAKPDLGIHARLRLCVDYVPTIMFNALNQFLILMPDNLAGRAKSSIIRLCYKKRFRLGKGDSSKKEKSRLFISRIFNH